MPGQAQKISMLVAVIYSLLPMLVPVLALAQSPIVTSAVSRQLVLPPAPTHNILDGDKNVASIVTEIKATIIENLMPDNTISTQVDGSFYIYNRTQNVGESTVLDLDFYDKDGNWLTSLENIPADRKSCDAGTRPFSKHLDRNYIDLIHHFEVRDSGIPGRQGLC
jgi:hypothetical protein